MPVDPRIASPLDSAAALLAAARDAGAVIADESDVLKAQAADAVTEQNKLHDALTAKQASLAAAAAENARLHKLLDAGGSGIPLWSPATVVSAGSAWIVPDGTRDNIIVPAGAVGVTLYLGSGLWPKIPSRPFLSIFGDFFKGIGKFGWHTFDAPSGASVGGNGRYGIAECVRVGQEAQ